MMNCRDVENNLPLYEEDALSVAEKQAIEQHLKSCLKCAKAFSQLEKTRRLVKGLAEVEPPPWFKQKIMSGVREEAAKKSLAQKLFYPLRIKIPVQIMAAIFVAVFAVYIYRSGHEQMKFILPSTSPAPVIETNTGLSSEQTAKPSWTDKAVDKKKVYVPQGVQNKSIAAQDLPAGNDAANARKLEKSIPQENERALTMDIAKTMKSDAAVDKKDSYFAALPKRQTNQSKVLSPSAVEMERKKEGYVLGASVKRSGSPEKQIPLPKAAFSLHVTDTNTAAKEVTKILEGFGARKIVTQNQNAKVFLTAEIKVNQVKDLIAQLNEIGRVEGRDIPMTGVAGDLQAVIEIVGH